MKAFAEFHPALIFLAGALLAFLYSYIPLHNAKNWKIDYLEERLVAKDNELGELQRKLRQIETDSADKPDSQTFKQLQDELHTTDKTLKGLERQVAALESSARRRLRRAARRGVSGRNNRARGHQAGGSDRRRRNGRKEFIHCHTPAC